MLDYNSGDTLERYQYLAFKWVLFIVFIVMAYQFLDHHTKLSVHGKRFLDWIRLLVKQNML
jgi:hypothetical protein